MRTFTEPKKLQAYCRKQKLAGKKIALVPTMGYLHEGHLSLIETAKKKGADEIVGAFYLPFIKQLLVYLAHYFISKVF